MEGSISRIVDALNAAGVKFILVGGSALELHGSAYRTEDVDLVYDRDPENVARLIDALAPFGPRLRVAGVEGGLPIEWNAQTVLNGDNFTLTTSLGDIDVLGTVAPGWKYADLAATHAERYDIGERHVDMLTLDGLLATKRAAGRAKDHLALPEIEAMIEARNLEKAEGP